jgi:hypothetical protein
MLYVRYVHLYERPCLYLCVFSVIQYLFQEAVSSRDCKLRLVRRLMDDKLVRMSKETVVPYFVYCPD